MIEKLDNKNLEVAKAMYIIFQESYNIEAKLLKTNNFPPLQRPLEEYINCENTFFGYTKNGTLAGVVEIIQKPNYTHIRSLVVSPSFFRQGIASKLMQFLLKTYHSKLCIVETGLDNEPASNLYRNFGFTEVKQWDTSHGVRKIKFELKNC